MVALVANADTSSSQKGFLVSYGGSADNELYFYIGNRHGTAHATIVGGWKTFVPKTSYHVVATYDGSSAMALYANGNLIATGRFSGGAPDAGESTTTWIGATFSGALQHRNRTVRSNGRADHVTGADRVSAADRIAGANGRADRGTDSRTDRRPHGDAEPDAAAEPRLKSDIAELLGDGRCERTATGDLRDGLRRRLHGDDVRR